MTAVSSISRLRILARRLALAALLLLVSQPAQAHNGPPFPIIVDKQVGPCVISVWADPNIGPSKFYVIVNPLPGGTIPGDLTLQLGLQPVNGRLPEKVYPMDRVSVQGQVEYETDLAFDRDEWWHVRVRLISTQATGDGTADVEATPINLSRWNLLFYLFPFLAVAIFWFMATKRRRRRMLAARQRALEAAASAGSGVAEADVTSKGIATGHQ